MKSYLTPPEHTGIRNPMIFLLILYLWVLVVGPHQRFQFLEVIHFERTLMIVCWIVLIASNRIRIRFTKETWLLLALFCAMVISALFSPYAGSDEVKHWASNYWKLIVFYFLILFSINSLDDIKWLFIGLVVVVWLYQLHSWVDFLNGGAYVYQQGIKRIIGVWSSGVGAANAFGMIAMFSFPFALFWYRETQDTKIKRLLISYFLLTLLTIIFSGTRGAMLGFVIFVMLNIKSMKKFIYLCSVLALIFTIGFFALPNDLRYRYVSWIDNDAEYQIETRVAEIQQRSAQSRIEGLIDGWELLKKRPFLGYGPQTSVLARIEVRPEMEDEYEDVLQLHNLYGQVMSETGVLGTLLFGFLIMTYLSQLRKIKCFEGLSLDNLRSTFFQAMALMLYYGMVSHTLYRYYWIVLFACHSALMHLLKNIPDEQQVVVSELAEEVVR